jgi:sortase A
MRDKRSVDDLSIEELERVLAIKKREARQKQMARMKRSGRVVATEQKVAPPRQTPTQPPIQPGEVPGQPAALQQKQAQRTSPPPIISSGNPHFEDDVDWTSSQDASQDNDAWKRFVDVGLMLVEVAAVIGLLFIGVTLIGAIGDLEGETRASQERDNATMMASIPTLEPTPVLSLSIDDFVLPTGHTFDASGNVSFNIDEIPENVPMVVRNQAQRIVIERPPSTSATALKVNIDRLELDEAIFQGTDWEALRQGVGQVRNGVNPGDVTGNLVLAAHNDIYGELFRNIDQLQEGDQIIVQTEQRTYTYIVTGYAIVDPTDVYVMDNKGRPTLTLVSCYPFRVNNKRYIVFAERSDNIQAYNPIRSSI